MGLSFRLSLKFIVPFLALASSSALFATSSLPPCGAGTLSSYISTTSTVDNPNGGCAIGILDYYNFSYTQSSGPAASALEVTPTHSAFGFSAVNGQPITAAPNTTVTFQIDYQMIIDPAPVVTGGDLEIDPPTGNVIVTEYFCNDSVMVSLGVCSNNVPVDELQINSLNGVPSTASIVFPNPALVSQNIAIVFTLNGGANGASFDGVDSNLTVSTDTPEPASSATVLFGLLALAGGYTLRKRRTF